MPISQKGGQFKKSVVPLSRRNYVLSVGFKMKPLRKSFSCIKTETNSNFAENLAEMLKEAPIHFCLFDESHFSNICTL